jgi:SAM-dependent methyltransferase
MQPPQGNTLYDDPGLAQFYDTARQRDDFAFCTALARTAGSVLDLGCGTGELAAALSDGRAVTGVDPADAMIAIARGRPGGDRATWVVGDARTLRLGRRFDLVVLTGHSFQVFLTTADQRAVLATIAAHLAPGGRFVFDSRNPAFPGAKERTRAETLRRFDHPLHGATEAWNASVHDERTGILTYVNGYRVLATGKEYSATAQIRYTPRDALAALVAEAGLAVDEWFGDWLGTPMTPDAKEIVPLGRLA